MTRLFLIRHAATDWTERRIYQGLTDIPLNAAGKKQAQVLSKRLHPHSIHLFYHSALKRASETAAILNRKRKIKAVMDKRINEFHFGDWEGKTAQELLRRKDPLYEEWCRGRWVNPPGGESLAALKKRTREFLADILKRHEGRTIGIVTHGGPLRMMMIQSLGLPLRFFWSLHIEPASVAVLHFNNGRARWAAAC